MAEKILVVDDSSFIVDGLVAILKKKGYITIAAHGGDECLEILKKEIPDIIILDIMMEPMDGWETLEKVKENPATCDIPILMFSAKKITPPEAEAHRINIDDYVAKPVNPKQLLVAIERVIARKNSLRALSEKARAAGIDTALIDEYLALRMSCDVDGNLLRVLRSSTEIDQIDMKTREERENSIALIEARLKSQEERLHELTSTFDPIVGSGTAN
ncbi:MAG: response regulator [Methanoregulaceae archaeon]